jgi:penicillin-binding protein 2
VMSPTDTLVDNGFITVGGETKRNAGGRVNGRIDITRAMTVSSDVYFYEMGKRMWEARSRYGPTPMQDMARSLGLGDPTGIELPFEAGGRIPDAESRRKLHDANPEAFPTRDWYTGDNMNLAIGQGELAITPMQLANAYAAFANGGTLYAPRVASTILDVDHNVVRQVEPRAARTVDLPPTFRQPLLTGFAGAVADPDGTAFGAFAGFPLDTFPVAGKTGTAQVSGKQDFALFTAFAPANDPRYVVTVVMEEAGFGAQAAAPVARRILEGPAGVPPREVERSGGRD